jgi:hypothetical protein
MLFLDPRNMLGGKLPTTIALDQCVRKLHESINASPSAVPLTRVFPRTTAIHHRKAALTRRRFQIRRNGFPGV